MPGLWCLVHELLGLGECTTGSAFDRVARERERRASKADERHILGKLTTREPDRVHHVAELGVHVERGQALDIGGVANRPLDVWALSRGETQTQTERLEGQQDVGEDDRRIDAQAMDGLQRDLGGELGIVTQIEDGMALPELAVLRHVPTRLPHEPDWCDVGALPAARFKKPQAEAPRER